MLLVYRTECSSGDQTPYGRYARIYHKAILQDRLVLDARSPVLGALLPLQAKFNSQLFRRHCNLLIAVDDRNVFPIYQS